MKTKTNYLFAVILFVFSLLALNGFSVNPEVSKYLINLSEGEEGAGYDDKVPEMVISGNIIHVVWTQYLSSYQGESKLFYRRSTDLGETWEAPKEIMVFKDGSYGTQVASRRLAVDGDVVHICTADYDYDDNGTGRVHYFRSQNGGDSFESEQIIAATSGGYNAIDNCFIKASGGKVAVAYQGTGDKKGTWAMLSSNSGTSFSDTKISDESTYVADLYFDGGQMIVLHGYSYYMYGLNKGRVWVSTSENGTAFTTNKISVTYIKSEQERERCQVHHNYHYSSKIVRSGNNIHVIFTGYTEGDVYTTFYARSTNNGNSFETPIDIGSLAPESFQNGSETLAAKNGKVYFLAEGGSNRFYFAYSHDNGNSFSTPRSIMNPDVSHVGKASLPGITIDPTDETGKTLYLTGNWLFSTKSADGGETFSGSTSLAPFLKSNITNMSHNYMNSFMQIDNERGLHWITQAEWRDGNDQDIFYRNVKAQPEPGTENKAFYVENIEETREKTDLVVVPSSQSIQFDSAMTAEVWVKFNPETEAKFSILAKVDGYDGYDNRPEGYHIGFRYDDESIYVNAGLKTDKDGVVNWGEIDINDSVWHHIALTYDANGGLNNFKLYINGLLHQQTTLTGAIVKEDGMLMLGDRNMGNGWYYDAKYSMDDVRLWNRALTQEELLENQMKNLTGEEEGLALFINFDDTFKDITGKGNDGIPLYNGTLHTSDFDPPAPDFDLYQTGNSVSLNNKTKNATSWLWNFGDENTSEQGNPKYTYSTAGEYTISLLAKNANSVTGAVGHATIEGLDRIEPEKAGNYSYSSVSVFGGGLTTENTTLILRKEGETDIIGENLTSPGEGALSAFFDLTDKALGSWDMVVSRNGSEMSLPGAFTMVEAQMPEPWVNITGRGRILFNMWQTYTINFGNKGNVDAFAVPLWLAFTNHPDMEIEFIDFDVVLPEVATEMGIAEEIKAIDLFFETDEVLGQSMDAKVYPLVIPVIPANTSGSVHIRVKTPGDFELKAWMNPPWVEYAGTETAEKSAKLTKGELKLKVAECVTGVLGEGIVDIGTSAIPGVGCVWSVGKQAYGTYQTPPWDQKFSFWGTLWNTAVTVVDCGVNLSGVGAVAKGVGVFMANMAGYVKSIDDCRKIGQEVSLNERSIGAVSSFDPNEMVGPSGFGDQNYIVKYDMMPYTILFENKSEATAPAHIVTITDTLDLSAFDISNFGFADFGWGDTIFSPPGNELKEFSMDIDLRPELELITRVSAKLDTLTGVIKWEFLSLNPETMDLEEDPFLGFLPPNVSSPEGEGFVSYSVGLKEELGTNDEIRNKASIVFDANEPIITNEYLNTLDMDVPQSQVYPLEANIDSRFPVDWTGSDEGSGIRHYTIYVLENDTLLYPWLTNTTEITAEFIGEVGSTYKFYSIATDNVSHKEAAPNDYDAQTTVTVDVEEFERMKETLNVWPNPVKDNLQVTFSNAPCGMYVLELVDATGSVKHSQLYDDMQLQNGTEIIVSDCPPGQYVLRVVFGNKTETRKVVVN